MSRSQSVIKETSVQVRASTQQKEIISRAAKIQRTTLSNFVLENAYQAAQQVLAQHVHFTLSSEEWEMFCHALDQPAREIQTLKALFTESSILDG